MPVQNGGINGVSENRESHSHNEFVRNVVNGTAGGLGGRMHMDDRYAYQSR